MSGLYSAIVAKAIEETGGITVHDLDYRYIVSLEGFEAGFSPSDIAGITEELVKNGEVAAELGDNYSAGAWLNSEDGTVYTDVSTSFANLDEAMQFGRDNRQIAIYDSVNDREIPVRY